MHVTSKGQVTIPQEIRKQAGLMLGVAHVVRGRPHRRRRWRRDRDQSDRLRRARRRLLHDGGAREDLRRLPLPFEASVIAGQAHALYRRRGGRRTSLLPDFSMGAHATVSGLVVLTRRPTRYRSYFPSVRLIHPPG